MFGAIAGFFGKVFGTDAAIGGLVNNVTAGLDKLVYTDQERAETAAKDRSEARAMVVEWMKSTQGQNLARRLIALAITATWLSLYWFSILTQCVAIFVDNPDKLKQLSGFLLTSAATMDSAVMLILAFYFAAPHMGDIVQGLLGRKPSETDRKG